LVDKTTINCGTMDLCSAYPRSYGTLCRRQPKPKLAHFLNAKEATVLQTALVEMGHLHPASPITTDNSTTAGIMNKSVKQVCSKAIDMRFYWVRDRVEQDQFQIFWAPGRTHFADYFTKHHPPSHHKPMRPIILGHNTAAEALAYLQGCVKAVTGPTGTIRPPTVTRGPQQAGSRKTRQPPNKIPATYIQCASARACANTEAAQARRAPQQGA
jgi:hypothetical protein